MNSTRLRRLQVSSRVLFALAIACAIGAGWWWLASGDSADDDTVVLQVEPAVASLPPATIPPLTVDSPTTPPVTTPPSDTPPTSTPMPVTAAPPTTVSLSQLAATLGERGSAIPAEFEPAARPDTLIIDALRLEFPVRDVGIEDNGELEVPDETEIGWYRYGAAPGSPGATVLAGHVSWNGTVGPFYRLGELEPGDRVEVELDDGSTRVYEVTERVMYDKDALPPERIWRTSGPETLVLITCGGDFNPDINRYRQNIVVYAAPVEQIDAADGGTP